METKKTPNLAQNDKNPEQKAPEVKKDSEKTPEATQDASKVPEGQNESKIEIKPPESNSGITEPPFEEKPKLGTKDEGSASEEEFSLGIGSLVKYNLSGEECRKYGKPTGSRVDAIIIAAEDEEAEEKEEQNEELSLEVFPNGHFDSAQAESDDQVSFIVRGVKFEEAFKERTTLTWGVSEKNPFE